MIEPAQWIRKNAALLGVNPDYIGPASVDLELGGHIIEVDEKGRRRHFNLEPGEAFTFLPGFFYIAHSEETTYCPADHAWMLALKSSTGRKGLNHLHAGYGDPDFRGQVTFELVAHTTVTFQRGQRIVQLVYFALTEPTDTPYGSVGRYQGQQGATEARPDREAV